MTHIVAYTFKPLKVYLPNVTILKDNTLDLCGLNLSPAGRDQDPELIFSIFKCKLNLSLGP